MLPEKPPAPWPLPDLVVVLAEMEDDLTPEEWSERSGWPVEVVLALLRPTETGILRGLPGKARGVALRSLRERCGLTLGEAAGRTGIGLSTLETWERGQARPSEALLSFLLAAYGR